MAKKKEPHIFKNLIEKETNYLLDIWQNGSLEEWTEEAFAVIEEILRERMGELPPRSPGVERELKLDRIDALYQSGRFDEALDACDRLLERDPNADAYHYRALVREELGQADAALDDYRAALRLDPEEGDVWKDFRLLEKDREQVFLASPVKRRLDEALRLTYEDESGQALREIESVWKDLPALSRAYNYAGLIQIELEAWDQGIASFGKAVELNPRYSPARENLAYIRRRQEEERYRQAGLLERVEGSDIETPLEEEPLGEEDSSNWDFNADDLEPLPGWVYLNEEAVMLRGFPGYRTRPGRFGTDPLDTDFEEAHSEGFMLRRVFTARFRTRNPIYLALLTYWGIIFASVVLIPFVGIMVGDALVLLFGVTFFPAGVFGVALLANVTFSLAALANGEDAEDGGVFF